ncbi:juvenile hormone esterase-like [Plodia interpunctella]|uniref:juvenile hormone esterase-like n=1 Tax=Plodia interpunctella TaxID=58824 RepID=UPI002367B7E0|nr:juvenile hormone esterase-like [Plodia interpunctella]
MLYNIIKIAVLFLSLNNVLGMSRVDPLVNTNLGLIRGLRAAGGDYSMFLGIPYAFVDDANPFGPSIPVSQFDDTFEAYDDSASCPQIEEFHNSIVGTLDCLHLNIYVPNSASSRNLLPVLVWIHGGGFMSGSSGSYLYGPKYLVRHDVILVTLNYRLGPYGFMCLNNTEISGNQGLKDQVTALRWINTNIESFGGDSSKITIFGESAGGASVDLHLFYNRENLFQKVIMQSGTSLSPWVIQEPDDNAPLKLAAKLGLTTTDVSEALQFLAKVDTNLVIAATSALNLFFSPCIEYEFDNVDSFMIEHPINLNINKNIPVLLGYNNDEQLGFLVTQDQSYFENSNMFFDFLNNHFSFDSAKLTEMEELLRHFYIGDQTATIEQLTNLIDFSSDINFVHPTERTIQKYMKEGVGTIYHYVFSYNGQRNFAKRSSNITEGGASHADEISYLFDISFWQEEPTCHDQMIINFMTTLWTNFAKHSNPTPQKNDLVWLPVTESTLYYLDINKHTSLKTRPFNDRMAFWDLFYKLNFKLQKEFKEMLTNN